MSNISEKKLLTNNEVIKLIGVVVIVASAWMRMEYKYNETTDKLIKKMDEHILADTYEKQAMAKDISELRTEIEKLKSDAHEFIKSEFIKPNEPEVREKRKRSF